MMKKISLSTGSIRKFSVKNIIYREGFLLVLIIFLLSSLLPSCKDDDFTSNSSYKLSLSADTLSFDTVFTSIINPVKRILIYNNTSENIKIESLSLFSEHNCFQMNVNGKSGNFFHNLELFAKDSLYIFVQVKIEELGQNTPLLITDSIVFHYNGNKQKIILETHGQDVHLYRKKSIISDERWTNNKPYLIYDTLLVNNEASLRIEEGTKIYFHKSGTMVINGKLEIEGTLDNPVLLRGSRNDIAYNKIPYDRLTSQWGGIHITETSSGNIINHATIRNGNFGIWIDSAEIISGTYRLTLSNSEIHNTKQATLKATHANLYAYNSIISNGAYTCILLEGGDYLFNHCTVADYSPESRTFGAVILANHILFDKEVLSPLNVQFNNCIIYGSRQKELIMENINESNLPDNTFNYLFHSCLIRYQQSTLNPELDIYSSGFRNTIWNEDPNFQIINQDYLYNFHLNPLSAAINNGEPEILDIYPECRFDRDGFSRIFDGTPDIGAYEWIEPIIIE
jgi:hypothetical protein